MYYEEEDNSLAIADDIRAIQFISRIDTVSLPLAFACIVLAVALGGIWPQIVSLVGLTLIGIGWIAACLKTRLISVLGTIDPEE